MQDLEVVLDGNIVANLYALPTKSSEAFEINSFIYLLKVKSVQQNALNKFLDKTTFFNLLMYQFCLHP